MSYKPASPQWSSKQSPEEIRRRKNLKKGIEFTMLICGQEGSGKASFINALCNQVVLEKDTPSVKAENAHVNPGVEVVKMHVNIAEEGSTPISLEIVLFPGFGDNIDNTRCTSRVVDYLERQFDHQLQEELSLKRDPRFKDGRPHAALYFIKPTTRGLRELDISAMKELSTRVNVIPVLAKSDSLTEEEKVLNKKYVMSDITANEIPIYDFYTDSDDGENESQWLLNSLPFAIAGSYEVGSIDGEKFHVREYPWGTMKVEDPDHSDFAILRNSIFGSHLEELKSTTHSVLYENYRSKKLAEGGINSFNLNASRTSPAGNSKGSRVQSMTHNTAYIDSGQENQSMIEIFEDIESNTLDDLTLREIETKRKKIEAYMNDLMALENRLRLVRS